MNYLQIQEFLTIVKYMNLSTAAKELFISQPALSLSLSRLETFLGVKLFFRGGNRLELTPAGETLLTDFQKLQEDIDNLILHAEEVHANDAKSIYIGFSCSASQFATMYLNDFLAFYNGNPIKKFFLDAKRIKAMLKSKDIDLAISNIPISGKDFSRQTIMKEEIGLVVSSEHPLAKKKSVKFKDIIDLPMINITQNHYFRILCDRLCAHNDYIPYYVKEVEYHDQVKLIRNMAGGKEYASFVAQNSFRSYYGDGYTKIKIDAPNMFRTTSLVWLAERKLQYEYADLFKRIIDGYEKQANLHVDLIKSF